MKVLIDTSAFVASLVQNETDHEKVAKKYAYYRQQRALLFTSDYIIDELFTRLLYYKIDVKKHIEKFRDAIAAGEITILRINELFFEKALDIFIKFSEHKISFTDATTYVLYKDFAFDEVFTLDEDFKKVRVKTSF